MSLHSQHRHELEVGSGISPEVIAARGAYTATTQAELRALGFADYQALAPALVLPIHSMNGWEPVYAIKPDNPRTPAGKDKPLKYEYPAGAANRLDCPPATRAVAEDPTVPLLITEGWKKVDAAITAGYPCIGLGGVWNWLGKHDTPHSIPLADFGYFTWSRRRVAIVFDSDVATNKNVREARERLCKFLESLGARVYYIDLPAAPDGSKQGLDDYLVANPGAPLWDMAYDPDDIEAAKVRRELEYSRRLQSATAKAQVCRGAKYVPVVTRLASAIKRMKEEGKPPATEDGLYYVSKAAIGGKQYGTDDWDIKQGTVKNHTKEIREYKEHIPGFRAEKRRIPFRHEEPDPETGELLTVERYEETWVYDFAGGPAEMLEILPTLPYPEETRGGKRCPKCGSQNIRRLGWRCDDCNETFEHPAQDIAAAEERGANFAPIGKVHTDSPSRPMEANSELTPEEDAKSAWDSLYERAEKATRTPARDPGQSLPPPPESPPSFNRDLRDLPMFTPPMKVCPGCSDPVFCRQYGQCPFADHLKPQGPRPATNHNYQQPTGGRDG